MEYLLIYIQKYNHTIHDCTSKLTVHHILVFQHSHIPLDNPVSMNQQFLQQSLVQTILASLYDYILNVYHCLFYSILVKWFVDSDDFWYVIHRHHRHRWRGRFVIMAKMNKYNSNNKIIEYSHR